MKTNKIYNIDALEILKELPDNSVDLVLTDPPYEITACDWDKGFIEFLDLYWKEWLRVGKENCAFVFTATMKFAIDLIISNRKMFRYDLVWEKANITGYLDANRKPLNAHENILVFYPKLPTYNPQKVKAKFSKHKRKEKHNYKGYAKHKAVNTDNKGEAYPKSVLYFSKSVSNSLHPTQKPVDLFRYLIKTYTNENDLVLDSFMGSGTTAIACIKENRNFVGSELDQEFFEIAKQRIENEQKQTKLF